MKNKIKSIASIFYNTFTLILRIDPTIEGDDNLIVTKEDRLLLKELYKEYNMKRFTYYYSSFEGIVMKHCLDTGLLPVESAVILCKKLNK